MGARSRSFCTYGKLTASLPDDSAERFFILCRSDVVLSVAPRSLSLLTLLDLADLVGSDLDFLAPDGVFGRSISEPEFIANPCLSVSGFARGVFRRSSALEVP